MLGSKIPFATVGKDEANELLHDSIPLVFMFDVELVLATVGANEGNGTRADMADICPGISFMSKSSNKSA